MTTTNKNTLTTLVPWGGSGVYAGSTKAQIAGTLATLRHYRAFLRSDSSRMRDPHDSFHTDTLTKPQAQERLRWLVHVAICRKAGYLDDRHSRELAPGLNHRGAFPRYRTGDAQRHLSQIAYQVNAARLRVYRSGLGEWNGYLLARLPNRFSAYGEE